MLGRFTDLVVALVISGGMILSALPTQAQSFTEDVAQTNAATGTCASDDKFAIAVHGGAVFRRGKHGSQTAVVEQVLVYARSALMSGVRAIDVVEAVIADMENSGLFNAGKGSIANQVGVVEMDAAIMDGRSMDAGSVASIKTAKNPISAARLVMEKSRHVMLVGPGADAFLGENGIERADSGYFLYGGQNFDNVPLPSDLAVTLPDRGVMPGRSGFSGVWAGVLDGSLNVVLVVEAVDADGADVIYPLGPHPSYGDGQYLRLRATFIDDALQVTEPVELGGYTVTYRLKSDDSLDVTGTKPGEQSLGLTMRRAPGLVAGHDGGTVGAVARDRCGDLAAGTSTGGFDSMRPGRVGDSPIIGAGTFADNDTVAVSATGHGETFMRYVAAYAVSAAMKYKGLSVEEAATTVVNGELRQKGLRGGVIAIDPDGKISMRFNTEGMLRGETSNEQPPNVRVY